METGKGGGGMWPCDFAAKPKRGHVVPFLFFCVVYRDMEGFSLFLGSLICKIPFFFFRQCAEVLGAGGRTADGGRWGIFRVTERRGFAKSASPESDKDEGIRHHCAYSG